MPDFSMRSSEPELMDQGGIPFEEFHHCLRSLETINHLTLAYRPTLRWLEPWLKSGEPLTILDAGSGGGDMLRQIAGCIGRRKGTPAPSCQLIGVDLHPWSKKSAELTKGASDDLSDAHAHMRFETADIFSFESDTSIDLIICSLFTHHLSDEQLIHFLRWLDQRAERGWFINDLHRHPLPYHFIRATTAVFSSNRLIRHDAPVSVARAFNKADWQRLLGEAGIAAGVEVRWYFPFRICIAREKTHVHTA